MEGRSRMRVGSETVSVVTGASGGVGRATARMLGERRAKVACWRAVAMDWKQRSARSNRAAGGRLRFRRMSASSIRCKPPLRPPNASSDRSISGSTTQWYRCIARS